MTFMIDAGAVQVTVEAAGPGRVLLTMEHSERSSEPSRVSVLAELSVDQVGEVIMGLASAAAFSASEPAPEPSPPEEPERSRWDFARTLPAAEGAAEVAIFGRDAVYLGIFGPKGTTDRSVRLDDAALAQLAEMVAEALVYIAGKG